MRLANHEPTSSNPVVQSNTLQTFIPLCTRRYLIHTLYGPTCPDRNGTLSLDLQPVSHTTITSIHTAVVTSITVDVAISATLVTLSVAIHLIPIIVAAVMVIDYVLTYNGRLLWARSRRGWKRLRVLGDWWDNSIGNLLCASQEPCLRPSWALTSFPVGTAYVAPLSLTTACDMITTNT